MALSTIPIPNFIRRPVHSLHSSLPKAAIKEMVLNKVMQQDVEGATWVVASCNAQAPSWTFRLPHSTFCAFLVISQPTLMQTFLKKKKTWCNWVAIPIKTNQKKTKSIELDMNRLLILHHPKGLGTDGQLRFSGDWLACIVWFLA